MARTRQQQEALTAQIYEDPEPPRLQQKTHSRVASVGEILRGRKKPTSSADKPEDQYQTTANPLGERHVNSPPPPPAGMPVPLRREEEQQQHRRPMHKKTGSAVSLKELIMGGGKDSSNKCVDDSSSDSSPTTEAKPQKSPKKKKSSTNLAGFLRKKKSKRDLEDGQPTRDQENVSPTKKAAAAGDRTPVWEQMATHPLQDPRGTAQRPQTLKRTIEEEIALYTPKDYSEFRPHEQRNFYGYCSTPMVLSPPQIPRLEHKGSRSSIFTENIDEDGASQLQRPKSRDHSKLDATTAAWDATAGPSAHGPPNTSRIAEMRSKFEEKSASPQLAEPKERTRSRVFEALSTLGGKSKESAASTMPSMEKGESLSAEQLDRAFETVLEARNIPLNMRETMRNLKPDVKAALMRGDRSGSDGSRSAVALNDVRQRGRSPTKKEERPKSQEGEAKQSRSRSRPRSGILTLSRKDEGSPTKRDKSTTRARSKSRPKSVDLTALRPSTARSLGSSGSVTSLTAADSAATPGDFIHYFHEVQKPSLIEVGKLHKLRILLRNESVSWTDQFVRKGGMDELVSLLYRIMKIEWREEHEDNLLHETLLCLKGLCTTELALQKLAEIEHDFFPAILNMLFDPERKGPSEFSTRGVIVSLLFAHLSAMQPAGGQQLEHRARSILGFLQDPTPEKEKHLVEFVSQMHAARPYRIWCKEVVNVTKDVFWIFLHHFNVVPIVGTSSDECTYVQAHFPAPRPPHPAAPYVGGVEWEATQYIALHLDLLNGLIASLPTSEERNLVRAHLRQSGWEKVMGCSLRTCKEKFYAGVHDGLKVWVAAASADGWHVEDVRAGPPREGSARKAAAARTKADEPPPKIWVDVDVGVGALPKVDDAWL
ncbi:hypothetical protein DV735_g3856, partial [Chaetothyriales sp. CBS 134920]